MEGENHVRMSKRTNKLVRKYMRKIKPKNVEVSRAFATNVDISNSVSNKKEAWNSEMAHFQNDYPKLGHYDIIGSSTLVDTAAYSPSHIPGDERTTGQMVHRQGICTNIHRRPFQKPSTLVGVLHRKGETDSSN